MASGELPADVREMVAILPEYAEGLHLVAFVLSEGRTVTDVKVARTAEIVSVAGSTEIPFSPSDIRGVVNWR